MANRISEAYESLTHSGGDWDPEEIGLSESAVVFGAAILGGLLAREAVKAGWQAAFREDPPLNPASSDVDWSDALLWGLASGALVGTFRIFARRGASGAYRKLRG